MSEPKQGEKENTPYSTNWDNSLFKTLAMLYEMYTLEFEDIRRLIVTFHHHLKYLFLSIACDLHQSDTDLTRCIAIGEVTKGQLVLLEVEHK